MKISGPFFDQTKRGQPCPWFLRYSVSKPNPDGTTRRTAAGQPVLQRLRPHYASKAKAQADIPRIREQHDVTGTGNFLFNREAACEFESAKKIIGEVSLVEVAKFWRRHHPDKPKPKLGEIVPLFLADIEVRLGKGRHWSDRKSRLKAFLAAGFSERYPDTVERDEILSYLMDIPEAAPRTRCNHKTAVFGFFSWLVDQKYTDTNPAAGIKKRMLPKVTRKEIKFLSLAEVERYLRAAERYAPEIIAHEIVQLVAGVRSDEEMGDFRAEFVLPQTKEILIPEEIAKTDKREVIQHLEKNFWAWWKAYGKRAGLLRPKYYEPRWNRVRVLASIEDQTRADELARLPIKTLLKLPEAKQALTEWPWNARRRTFCTYHVAKHQSAERTVLIMRHRGGAYTLHNSYRGLGVTQEQGRQYFDLVPQPCAAPISPVQPMRGVVLHQKTHSKIGREVELSPTQDDGLVDAL